MNILGDDIKIIDGDISFTPGNGDFDTASGIDCLIQDILEELQFPYLDDPDHPDRGNALYCINVPSNQFNIEKLYIKQELTKIMNRDPRIKKNSVSVSISYNENNIIACITFVTINNIVENLIIPIQVQGVLQ
jgi:hypothetical protein